MPYYLHTCKMWYRRARSPVEAVGEVVTVVTSDQPGRHRAHASIMGMSQPSVHSPAPKLTHATPSHPLERSSEAATMPMRRKNPLTVPISVPHVLTTQGRASLRSSRTRPVAPRRAPAARRRRLTRAGELVPVEAPDIRDRCGRPQAVGKRRPLPGWLPEDDALDECRDVVEHIDIRVHHHVAVRRIEGRNGPAREQT